MSKLFVSLLLTVPLCGGAGFAVAGDVQAACTRTVYDYARAWDLADGPAFGALFTESGTLDLGRGPVVGRQAIAALPKAPNETLMFRHLMTNVSIDVVDEKTAKGVSYLLLFMVPRPKDMNGPVEVDGFQSMGEYHDTFSISADGCKIAERKLVGIFRQRPVPAKP